MKIKTASTLFFCALLIASAYTIPNQTNIAYAHQNSGIFSHEFCWDVTFNSIYYILSIIEFVAIAILMALAPITFGASLLNIPPLKQGIFFGKVISPAVTWPAAALGCSPETIAPPSTVADQTHLDCNDEQGFTFTNIENTIQNTGEFKYPKKVVPKIVATSGPDRDAPPIFALNLLYPSLLIIVVFLIFIIKDAVSLYNFPSGGDALLKKFFEFSLKSAIFQKIIVALLGKVVLTIVKAPGALNWRENVLNEKNTEGFTTHAFASISDLGVQQPKSKKFELGLNTLTYFGTAKFALTTGKTDTATLPFNVYDSESPKINFGTAKNVTVEANTHYGFDVTPKSLPQIKLGTSVSDNCSPLAKVDLEYIGPEFYLLTKLKKDQYAPWKATDYAPPNYYTLSDNDIEQAITKEIPDLLNSPDGFFGQRIAQVSPTQQVIIPEVKLGASTVRHVIATISNDEVLELISNNTDAISSPPTADVIISGELRDKITDDKITIIGQPEKEDQLITDIKVDRTDIFLLLSQKRISSVLNNPEGFIADVVFYFVGTKRPTTLQTEVAKPNVFADFQFVTVTDTTAPNILVTGDLALEINSTNPESTNSTLLNDTKNGCSGIAPNIWCILKIKPPAVFDIADPFPTLFQNYTDNGTFQKVEGNLIGNFTTGVSLIGWKAVDFSGRGDNNIVTQIVNLKLNGTNIVSNVFDVNATVFSTVPTQVTLIANNTDKDPLKFFIESNPSKGILDTPIDAVFLTKFQLFGQVSKLKGITNEAISSNDIFFTDSDNGRVMKIDNNDVLEQSFLGTQLGIPIGISMTGTGDFVVSDWSQNKIITTSNNGDVLQTFDITGLFKIPEYISVNQTSNDIFVTDSGDATISKLSDFGIFNVPEGIEIDTNSGNVYVADNLDNTIKIFNSSGFSLGTFGSGQITTPTDIAVDSTGNIYVIGLDNKIKNYTSDFTLEGEFGTKANSHSFFNAPQGITINDSTIFVADTQNNKIQKITSFDPQIFENYTSTTNWFQNDTGIQINGGVVDFNNATSGPSSPIKRVFKDLQTTLDDTFSAEFEIKSGDLKTGANAFIWLLTNNTKHPQNTTSQDALGVIYDDQELKIFERRGISNTTSTPIPLPNGAGIDYFVSFDKINSTQASLVVYTDSAKSTQLTNGNVTHTISNLISNLHVLQHANDIVQGSTTVDLLIDDTFINPLVSWIGKCDSGPNCIGGISNQFTCTDTTCFGQGTGSNNGQFDLPVGISSNSTHIFVSDFSNNRIQILDISDGAHKANLSVTFPTDVEYTNFDGGQIIASSGLDQIHVFPNDDTPFVFGKSGPEQGNFTSPTGLAIDNTANIYVTDNIKDNVQKFDNSGNYIQEWKSSINSRFGDFIERFEFYVFDINAGALDVQDNIVMIGDWNSVNRDVLVANSHGGNLLKLDLPLSIQEPHSLAFNSTNKIFITDPVNQNIALLDGTDGNLIKNIDVSNISGHNITPTGITITNDVSGFSGEQLFVFDNSTEKIFAINEGANSATVAFDAKDLFSNLNDIAFNSTHAFGLDISQNKSSIVQIRLDKGIKEITDIGQNVTGIAQGKGIDSDVVFFTSKLSDNELLSYNLTDSTISNIINLTKFNVIPSGVGINPMISGLVNITINDDSPSKLNDPRGLTFSNDNKTMYVASGSTNEIKIFDVNAGNLLKNISDEQMKNPTDILLNDDMLYVASTTKSKIFEVNVTSDEVSTFLTSRSGISHPAGLAISPDGRHLFVSQNPDNVIAKYWLNDIITETLISYNDTSGDPQTFTQTFENATKGTLDSLFVNATNRGTLQDPQGIAFGPDASLYVASFGSNEILKWDQFGNYVGVFGDANNTKSNLDDPTSLVFSQDGKSLYVSSVGTSSILQYDGMTGEFVGVFSDETVINPDGLAVGKEGNLFVSNRGTNEILEYGKLKVRYYVSDWTTSGNRLIGFNSTGDVVGTPFVPNVSLNNPQNIDIDNKGHLWIVDAGPPPKLYQLNPVSNQAIGNPIDLSALIEKEAPIVQPLNNTKFVDDFGNIYDTVPLSTTLTVNPEGISIGKSDDLYITDWNRHRIIVLNDNGEFLGQVKLNSTFTKPLDIAVNQTDSGNLNEIFVYDANFTESDITRLVSLDVDKQFETIEFADVLSPFLRGLDVNGTFMITTPSNSGSLFKINSTNEANFDSEHFTIPQGIDLSASEIYVTDWKEKRIVELNSLGNFISEFDFKLVGFPTSDLGDIEVDTTDQLFWITEPRRATIDQVGFDGTVLKYSSIADKYVFISAVDSDALDNFYVASQDKTISKFDIRGTLLAKSDPILDANSFIDITIGYDPTNSVNSIFVATTGNDKEILKYNSTDLQQIGTGIDLSDKCGECSPAGLTIDSNGSMYVSNSTMKITKLNSDGSLSNSFTIPGTSGEITDIKIGSDDSLYASDQKLNRVYKYNITSDSLTGWLGKCDTGSTSICDTDSFHSKGFTCTDATCSNSDGKSFGRDVGQFFQPTHLALDGLDNVYVSDVKLSRTQISVDTPDVDFSDIFNRGNVPRVQKFTQDGFYVQHVISDTNQTLVKGNFEWVKGLAYGTNNFYVADVDKLHVFDVNPFRNIKFDSITNFTSAQVTYESLIDIGMIANDTDSFLYKVFDGFSDSSNIGNVTLTVTNPDLDDDGIFGDIDLSAIPSDDFVSLDGTLGTVLDRGGQKLIIREARDPIKGVYIQADIRNSGANAMLSLCDNSRIEFSPGDRLEATCILEDGSIPVGIEIKILRGEVQVKFLDDVGRESTTTMLSDDELSFFSKPFSFISGNNFDTLKQTVTYNGKIWEYKVPPNSMIKVDVAPPILPEDACNTPLILEAESVRGIQWTGNIADSPITQATLTKQFNKILKFLNFTSLDVDNGNPVETQGRIELVTSNASAFFQYSNSSIPFENKVQFFTVDKIGNNSTCINTVNVIDQTKPHLVFEPSFTNPNDANGIGVTTLTHPNSEVGRVFYDVPKIIDLPNLSGIPLEVEGPRAVCSPVSGGEFKVGDTPVVCIGHDLSDNNNSTSFTVTVNPRLDGLTIKNVTASSDSIFGLSIGDKIQLVFSVPTNEPPVSTTSQLNSLLNLTNGNLGNNVTGQFLGPNTLEITINDILSPIDLVPGITIFDLKSYPDLTSASGILDSSGTNGISNPITLSGDFSSPAPPYITSFTVSGSEKINSDKNSEFYSNGDVFTIRFSESTSHSFGGILDKSQVDTLFSFSQELGTNYVGVWKNPSTFVIPVKQIRMGLISDDPTLGTTTAQVIGDIRNKEKSSIPSSSISPPLSGSFGKYGVIKDILPQKSLVETLPSGVLLGINFPNGTTVFLEKSDIVHGISIQDPIQVSVSNSTTDCLEGCDVSFTIQVDDLIGNKGNLNKLRIFHDANENGVVDSNELIKPLIEHLNENLLRVSITLHTFSPISLLSLAGGGSNAAYPSFESGSIESGKTETFLDEIHYNNSVEKSIIHVGDPLKIKLTLNLSGREIEHISLYTDLREFKTQIWDSDVYVRYDRSAGVSTYDPQGFFKDADIFILKNGDNHEIEFTLVFAKPMKESDIVIRAWNVQRDSSDTRFIKTIEVIDEIKPKLVDEIKPKLVEVSTETNDGLKIEYSDFEKWAGFSEETLSDTDFLNKIGIIGEFIPSWYKKIIPKLIVNGEVSFDEFIDALKFFEKQEFLN